MLGGLTLGTGACEPARAGQDAPTPPVTAQESASMATVTPLRAVERRKRRLSA